LVAKEGALMERTFRDSRALGSRQRHVYYTPSKHRCKKVKEE
jgi:hypothetical protein